MPRLGRDSKFGPEEQKAMATSAHEILYDLNDFEKKHQQCIPNKVVYGLHLDDQKLRILAHFVNRPGSEPSSQWDFCQVVVAQHLITMNPDCNQAEYHDEDDNFLERWNVTRALFTIRREVENLKEIIKATRSREDTQEAFTSISG